MKYIYASLFGLLCALSPLPQSALAQRVIWSEHFNIYPQINFTYPWSTPGTANFPWRCDVPYLIYHLGFISFENGTKLAGINDIGQNEDAILMTPPINLGVGQDAWMSYDSYFKGFQNGGKTESATVAVTTDNGANWTPLKAAPVSPGRGMVPGYVDLSGFDGYVRIGFRYSDSGQTMFGWMVDNIKVFAPSEHDVALIHVSPENELTSYYPVSSFATLSGVVRNTGTKPITAFDIAYREGGGPIQTHTVSGVNIAPFDTFSFVHSVPYELTSIGKRSLKMWAVLPADTVHSNDTLPLSLNGALFMPTKKVVIEEGTGTWNEQAPRGIVYMHALDATDDPPTRITVHSEDIMGQKAYADYLYYMDQTFTPYFIFDRRGEVPHPYFFERYEQQRQYFGFADIEIRATAKGGYLDAEAVVKPAVDLPGEYRVALVITEDGVRGTTKDYNQENAFMPGGRNHNEAPMGGYENKPDPIPAADMVYDYVARAISPTPEGKAKCLPPNMKAGQTYGCSLNAAYSSAWKLDKLNAIILLIRSSDSSILNSRSVPFRALGIEEFAGRKGSMQVHPNPAGFAATLTYTLAERALTTLTVTDITGRAMMHYPARWFDAGGHREELQVGGLPSGMYFITLDTGKGRETVKLSVVH